MEKYLISHCAPTLAGIKTANLFNYKFVSKRDLLEATGNVSKILNPKGVFVEILCMRHHNALLLVYRVSLLTVDLAKENIKKLLDKYGYRTSSLADCISCLKERLSSCCEFPHEVGVFLGYPPEDVIGFIENRGQNSKCAGCWKVYCDESEAARLFVKYQKCKDVYIRLYYQGKPIERLPPQSCPVTANIQGYYFPSSS